MYNESENYTFKIAATSPRGQEVNTKVKWCLLTVTLNQFGFNFKLNQHTFIKFFSYTGSITMKHIAHTNWYVQILLKWDQSSLNYSNFSFHHTCNLIDWHLKEGYLEANHLLFLFLFLIIRNSIHSSSEWIHGILFPYKMAITNSINHTACKLAHSSAAYSHYQQPSLYCTGKQDHSEFHFVVKSKGWWNTPWFSRPVVMASMIE